MSTKFTILGEVGSGKTCYLLGMYYEMSAGIDGYSIIAPNEEEDRTLAIRYQKLNDISLGKSRFPEPTDSSSKYNFELQYAFNTIMPFEWIDYPGQYLEASKRTIDSDYREVEKSIYESKALFICVDGVNLMGEDTDIKIRLVKDKCSRNISPYLGKLQRDNKQKKLPPIAIIITKFDLCAQDTNQDEIREIVEKAFNPLFAANNTFIVIIPVSLGSFLQDDEYRGHFSPINLHLPIYMGIWFSLKDIIKENEQRITQTKEMIIELKHRLNEEENRFFLLRSNDKIRAFKRDISNAEETLESMRANTDEMKRNSDELKKKLYSINLCYINRQWRK